MMTGQRILVVEAEGPQATRILSALDQSQHVGVAVTNCAEAAEAVMLQRFDAVLLGSGQAVTEITELAGCIHGAGNGALLLSYGGEQGLPVDGVLPQDFDPAQLERALNGAGSTSAEGRSAQLAVFEPEAFAEQCADETSLMVEIIDLFEGERETQEAEMAEALSIGDFDRLSKLAHTLKGSVGALHAPAARQTCQAIELAAKDGDPMLCGTLMTQLERNLDDLAGPLNRFKQSCLEAG